MQGISYEAGGILFQTRHGAYFVVNHNDGLEPWEDGYYEKLIPLDPEQAQRWAEQYCSAEGDRGAVRRNAGGGRRGS